MLRSYGAAARASIGQFASGRFASRAPAGNFAGKPRERRMSESRRHDSAAAIGMRVPAE
jgi:hypothetical protein